MLCLIDLLLHLFNSLRIVSILPRSGILTAFFLLLAILVAQLVEVQGDSTFLQLNLLLLEIRHRRRLILLNEVDLVSDREVPLRSIDVEQDALVLCLLLLLEDVHSLLFRFLNRHIN